MLGHAIVSGANGFVGFAVVKELLKCGTYVTALIHKNRDRLDKIEHPNLKIVEVDMNSYQDLPGKLNHQDADVFFHFAWMGSAGEGRFDPEVQMRSIQASIDACEVAKAVGCTTFVGAGSIMEDETLKVAGLNGKSLGKSYMYGAAKLSAHLLTQARANALGVKHVWPKITNAYGPEEYSPRFINTTLRKFLNHEPLQFTSGTQNYDFIYIDDVARAFVACAEFGMDQTSYVLGSGHAQALRNFIQKIGETIDPDQKLDFGTVPYAGVQMDLDIFSIESLKHDTGFEPCTDFETGILNTFKWIKGV